MSAAPMASAMHEERLDAVMAVLRAAVAEAQGEAAAGSVLDLGCGSGVLLTRLAAEARFKTIVGIDADRQELTAARRRLESDHGAAAARRVILHEGSFAVAESRLAGFDTAAMVETIEHIDPDRLSTVERAVFGCYRPKTLVMTTPNREYNPLLNMRPGKRRHSDHRFEWDRAKLADWAAGVARRNGYTVTVGGVGVAHPTLGCATQIAVFKRLI